MPVDHLIFFALPTTFNLHQIVPGRSFRCLLSILERRKMTLSAHRVSIPRLQRWKAGTRNMTELEWSTKYVMVPAIPY